MRYHNGLLRESPSALFPCAAVLIGRTFRKKCLLLIALTRFLDDASVSRSLLHCAVSVQLKSVIESVK